MNAPHDELLARAEIGDEARKFMDSDLGRCVLGLARQEVDSAMLEFKDVNVTDTAKLMDLKTRVWCAHSFEAWLVDLVTDGEESIKVFQQQRAQEQE